MRNIKLTIEYDGSKYNGWQRLGNTENTIQFKIESVLSRMTGENIEVIASGRTDAGVHALNQVVNFKTNKILSSEYIRDYCNKYLPKDIVIKDAEEVDDRFHARYNAKSKKYLYRIWTGEIPTAFHRKYTYYIPHYLDIEAMKKASSYFIGKHDFKAFSSVKSKKKSTIREIYEINIKEEGKEIQMMFHGNGFLYNMVRIMVGTLIEVGEGKRRPEEIEEIINTKVRQNAGPTAPAQGLFLYQVYYEGLQV
ncbi:tRNA pseudouridine(38-40) synthase TruA [Crassaminicella thermophila]|uniref:tRNA pseudouridine synthase A n=1 Tax=Crassaminicella thermophila TaxID=2599308 RepID=A0A5C0SBH3_CRATE|nr:tRNA pseudouridine(38-40) synthase TruA [Crassaminicella thermophila]QEK11036.1 tRNA pseudouridine(38-40) synthase TruA [Crassaminicella thermophila]